MVDDGAHAGPRLVYGAMDEALGVRRSSARIDRRSVEPELHQVVELDALGRARAGKKVAVRSIEMADAHVPERIDDALQIATVLKHVEQNAGQRQVGAYFARTLWNFANQIIEQSHVLHLFEAR